MIERQLVSNQHICPDGQGHVSGDIDPEINQTLHGPTITSYQLLGVLVELR